MADSSFGEGYFGCFGAGSDHSFCFAYSAVECGGCFEGAYFERCILCKHFVGYVFGSAVDFDVVDGEVF